MNNILSIILGSASTGILVGIGFKGLVDFLMHKRQWSDEIKKAVILKKLQVSEDAMACLQSIVDELMQLKMICDVESDIPSSYLEWCRTLSEHMKALYSELQSKLNQLCVYYDFSSIDEKYGIYKVLEDINKDVAKLSLYSQHIVECESPSLEPVQIIDGEMDDIKPLLKRLSVNIQIMLNYAGAVQEEVRTDISGYCK